MKNGVSSRLSGSPSLKPSLLVFYSFLLYLFTPSVCYAYLDPSTGSYFMQVLLGVGIGIAACFKFVWWRVKGFFSGIFRSGKPS